MSFSIAIHGGAGTILKKFMDDEKEKMYKECLREALKIGSDILAGGGQSIDAVEAAVVSLEDQPFFNAGRGSVFTFEGRHEMDASIMEGQSFGAGAVTGISNVKNPIKLARAVKDRSQNVLLAGKGAEAFAREIGLEFMPDEYFFTKHRYDQLQNIRNTQHMQLDHTVEPNVPLVPDDKKFGTVGAVALDKHGNLAAATSTGGMTNKKYGRVGDSPIIGAGTYANNRTCAISCTGHGEYFLRGVVAYDVSCLMEYKGYTLKEACHLVVYQKLINIGGEGGLIAVDIEGNIEMPFNSEGMYRAKHKYGEEMEVMIYK